MIIAGPIGVQIVGIVRKIGATFNKIVEDPIAFVGHLVDALKKGDTSAAGLAAYDRAVDGSVSPTWPSDASR